MGGRLGVLAVVLLCLSSMAFPSTWTDVEVACPVCGAVNTFKVPASYGTYVYQDPSRFQYVFWPATTNFFLHTCRQCHLTAYMQDFAEIPAAKMASLAAMLDRDAEIQGAVVPYHDIPMAIRLGIARKVYEELGRDDVFWCELSRIEGYHLANAGDAAGAHAARERALHLGEAMLRDAPAGERKETLVIIGTMRFFTGDIPGARSALEEAESLTYEAAERDSKALDGYLSQLIVDFRARFLSESDSR